jgi:predicted ribosome-associated RNA-binding protein Tma20
MARIQIRTTIDITNTGVRRLEHGTEKEFNQYRNFMTFHQVIGLRSIFDIIEQPKFDKDTWTMIIDTDQESVYATDDSPIGLLIEDLHQIPILTGLDEVKPQKQAIITTKGKQPNTFVSILQ